MQLELDKKSRKSLMAYKAVDECFHYWSSSISLAPLRLTFEVLTHQADFLLQLLQLFLIFSSNHYLITIS